MERRAFVRRSGIALSAGLAGCLGEDGTETSAAADSGTPTDTETPSPTAEPETVVANESAAATEGSSSTETDPATPKPAETETRADDSTATDEATATESVDPSALTIEAAVLGDDWVLEDEETYEQGVEQEFNNAEAGEELLITVWVGHSEEETRSQLEAFIDDTEGSGEPTATTVGDETYESRPTIYQAGVIFRSGTRIGAVAHWTDDDDGSVEASIRYAQRLFDSWQ